MHLKEPGLYSLGEKSSAANSNLTARPPKRGHIYLFFGIFLFSSWAVTRFCVSLYIGQIGLNLLLWTGVTAE